VQILRHTRSNRKCANSAIASRHGPIGRKSAAYGQLHPSHDCFGRTSNELRGLIPWISAIADSVDYPTNSNSNGGLNQFIQHFSTNSPLPFDDDLAIFDVDHGGWCLGFEITLVDKNVDSCGEVLANLGW